MGVLSVHCLGPGRHRRVYVWGQSLQAGAHNPLYALGACCAGDLGERDKKFARRWDAHFILYYGGVRSRTNTSPMESVLVSFSASSLSLGHWEGQLVVYNLHTKAHHRVRRRAKVYNTLPSARPRVPRGSVARQASYFPIFRHFLIVNFLPHTA